MGEAPVDVVVRRLGEPAQLDHTVLSLLHVAGLHPGATVRVQGRDGGVLVLTEGERPDVELDTEIAAHVFVAVPVSVLDRSASSTGWPSVGPSGWLLPRIQRLRPPRGRRWA